MTANDIEDLTVKPKIWSVLLYGQQFSRYRTFYSSPLTSMLNGKKKEKKNKCQKFKQRINAKNSNFQISLFF